MIETIMTKPKQLNHDVPSWGTEIMETIKEWPGLPKNTAVQILFKSKDEKEGNAVGSVVLVVAGGKPIVLPMVIQEFWLKPLDIMKVGGDFYPLTKRRVNEILTNQSPFDSVVNRMRDRYLSNDISSTVLPPGYSRGIGKAFSDGDEFLHQKLLISNKSPWYDELLRDIDHDDVERYSRQGTHDILRVVVNKLEGDDKVPDPRVVEIHGDHIKEVNPDDVRVIWVPAPTDEDREKGLVTVLGVGGRNFDPGLIHIPFNTALKLFSNRDGGDFMSTGRTVTTSDFGGVDPYSDPYEGIEEIKPSDISRSSHYKVLGANGKEYDIDAYGMFTLTIPGDSELLACNSGGHLLFGDKMYGKKVKKMCAAMEDQPEFKCTPSPKDIVFFLDKKDGHAVGPVRITSVTESCEDFGGENHPITVYAGEWSGKKVSVMVAPTTVFKDCGYSEDQSEIFLPDTYSVNRVHDITELAKDPAEVGYLAKLGHAENNDWISVASNGDGTFRIGLPENIYYGYKEAMDKFASFDLGAATEDIAEFVLCAAGVSSASTTAMLKAAEESSVSATYYGMQYNPIVRETLADYSDLKVKLANAIRCSLFKEGGYLADNESVDAALSLSLASPENIDSFIEAAPRYEEIIKRLSGSLMQARAQSSPVQEESLRKAIFAMENVLEQINSYLQAKKILAQGVQ